MKEKRAMGNNFLFIVLQSSPLHTRCTPQAIAFTTVTANVSNPRLLAWPPVSTNLRLAFSSALRTAAEVSWTRKTLLSWPSMAHMTGNRQSPDVSRSTNTGLGEPESGVTGARLAKREPTGSLSHEAKRRRDAPRLVTSPEVMQQAIGRVAVDQVRHVCVAR